MLPPLHYIAYANRHYVDARWNLASSNVPPYDLASLDVDRTRLNTHPTALTREAITAVAARYGVAPDRVAMTAATSGANHTLAAWLGTTSPRRRILLERPGYEPMWQTPKLYGLEVAFFDRPTEHNRPACLSLQRVLDAVDDQTAAVWLTNPHNPTGRVIPDAALAELASALKARGVLLYVDEVYLDFDGELGRRSAVHLGDNVVIGSSLTKVYGLGSLRFGWLVGPPDLIAGARLLQLHTVGALSGPGLALGLTVLDHLEAVKTRATAHLTGRAAQVAAAFATSPRVRWHAPDTGIVGMLSIHGVTDDLAFAEALMKDASIITAPGTFFQLPGMLRIGFGDDADTFHPALARLLDHLQGWRP